MYENIDRNLYTPMIRQYLEMKDSYPDAILFYRVGDFYELFFNDAIVGSKELEIVLTAKDAGTTVDKVPMCGVPYHAVEIYIEKLSQKGYKVAIADQMEEAGINKIVHREVTKIVTPGTNIDSTYLSEKSNNYLGALDKVGKLYNFSYIDLSTGESYITELYSLDQVGNEIIKLNIKEVVTSESVSETLNQYLSNILNLIVSKSDLIKIDDYLLSLIDGLNESLVITCKRLLAYVIQTQKRTLIHLKKFQYYKTSEYMSIDYKAAKALELVESIDGLRFNNNLFSVLDKCQTAMGSRFLKKQILFPLVNLNKINERLNLVEALINHQRICNELKDQLNEIYDLERIIGRISFNTLSPKDLIQLKKSIKVLPKIKAILNSGKVDLLMKESEKISEFNDLYQELDLAINEDAPFLLKDGNVIKRGYSKDLDDIRDIESTNKDFLVKLEQQERERTGIKSLRVGYNRVFGYYIEVTNSFKNQIKDEYGYIRKQTTTNSERFITQELKERETLILRSAETALKLEIDLFNKIREFCKTKIGDLQLLADEISYLDMLYALSVTAKANNYVKPEFSYYNELEIKNGRHPVVELQPNMNFIPNDLNLYNDESIMLITGPNMSGKSTFMRQIALIVIMAQIGSFVPAEEAKLPIFDKIFTRIGSSDNLNRGESSFMTEMIEVNNALRNATERSLIIFDEVGRGTATYDGMALAQSIIEYIHNNIGAKTLFSTHYHELTFLENSLPNLKNYHVDAKIQNENGKESLVFLHKVLPGATDQSYGINVAALANIPKDITYRAKDLLNKLVSENNVDSDLLSIKNYTKPLIINEVNPKEKQALDLLKSLDINSLSPMEALLKLNELKEILKKDE